MTSKAVLCATVVAALGVTSHASARTDCGRIGEAPTCSAAAIARPAGVAPGPAQPERPAPVQVVPVPVPGVADIPRAAPATSIGDAIVVHRNDGSTVPVNRIGDVLIMQDRAGRPVTCNKIGEVTLCN